MVKFQMNLIVWMILVLVLIVVAFTIFATVPAGYTGVLVTCGKVENNSVSPGLHLKFPWQNIVKLDNHIQTLRIATGTPNATTTDTAETKDQQLIPVFEFEVQYQLDPEMSYMIYINYGTNYAKVLLESNALQFIKETFALYNSEEIVVSKGEIPAKVMERLSAVTEPLGVNIVRINLVTYDFSPEYTQVLEERALLTAQLENNELQQKNETIAAQTRYDVAIKQAEKDAETKRIAADNQNAIALQNAETEAEVTRIQADNDAYVTRAAAEAERDARMAVAEAEKAELEAKSSGLNDYVIQQEFIQKWDGKLMPSFGDLGFGFTDYTDIIKNYLPSGNSSKKDRELWK